MVAQVDLQKVMGEVRERTFALVAHLDEEQLNRPFDPIMSPLAWDLGAHGRLRGPVAQPASRGAPTCSRRSCRALRRVRDASQGARGPRVPARRGAAGVHGAGPRARLGGPDRQRRRTPRAGHPPRAPAHRDDAARRCASPVSMPPDFHGPRPVDGTGLEMVEVAEGPFELGAPARGLRLLQRAPRATRRRNHVAVQRHRPHAGDERHLEHLRRPEHGLRGPCPAPDATRPRAPLDR